jgi:phosphoribosylanthranilate isomerase
MTRIKICGITEKEHALVVARAGADYLGMVFRTRSRRQVTSEKASEIIHSIRSLDTRPGIVGVFVNLSAIEVNGIAKDFQLDWVQLSGDETWEYCREIERPIIKAIHIHSGSVTQGILKQIEQGHRILADHSLICLLDTNIKGTYGGTGQSFNWNLAKEVSEVYPVFVAGGLTPGNVGQLLNEAHPWGVDVSSGVETGGIKDVQKIKRFIQNVKSLNRRT